MEPRRTNSAASIRKMEGDETLVDQRLGHEPSREFPDEDGNTWVATIRKRKGKDFKGRYYFFVRPVEGDEGDGHALVDVRWNSPRTAARTLRTMSEVELRRRLRSARGRAETPTGAAAPDAAE